MKNILITTLVFLVTSQVFSQNYKFGKVSKEELEEKIYPLDSSANAAILYKYRNTFFRYDVYGIKLITSYIYRIKIYNKDSLAAAVVLFDLGHSSIEYTQHNGWQVSFSRRTRIKD